MKAILMAAGTGSRMGQAISGPKCVLDIAGVPLIRHTASLFEENGIEVAVAVGFEKHMVIQALYGLNVTYYNNPFFKVTNSIASLWFSREFIDCKSDLILCNADVYFEQEILNLLLEDQNDVVMLSDRTRADTGDYFFKTNNGRIVDYGKKLTRENRDCEYVGIAKLRADFLPVFCNRLVQSVEMGEYDRWWENVLYDNLDLTPVATLDVGRRFWGEIDYIEDYSRILEHVFLKNRNNRKEIL